MCFWGWRFPYFWNGGFWGMPWMMIFGLIFWIIIILLVVYIAKNFFTGYRKDNKEELLNILKRRLANGEISEEEFERIKKILNL